MSAKIRKRCGNNNCCIAGCGSTYQNTDTSVKFYSFPISACHQKRRELWVKCVRREAKNGKEWQPTKYSRICSKHFIGNQRSGHPQNPAYVPTIFPEQTGRIRTKRAPRSSFKKQAQQACNSGLLKEPTKAEATIKIKSTIKIEPTIKREPTIERAPIITTERIIMIAPTINTEPVIDTEQNINTKLIIKTEQTGNFSSVYVIENHELMYLQNNSQLIKEEI